LNGVPIRGSRADPLQENQFSLPANQRTNVGGRSFSDPNATS
jgi:hypothetical protein